MLQYRWSFLVLLILVSFGMIDPMPATGETDLLVSSLATSEVLRYDRDTGAFVGAFVSAGSGGLDQANYLAFGPDGNLYVSDSASGVFRFDGQTGAPMGLFASGGGLSTPIGIAFGADNNLYVCSHNTDQVLRYNGTSGAFMDVFANDGGLSWPLDLAFSPTDGNLYVSSPGSLQVLRYDGTTGAFIDVFASGAEMEWPEGLVFGPGGDLYVTNHVTNGNDNVLRYDGTSGTFLGVFASGGGLSSPDELTFGPDGDLYVASIGTDSVIRYDGTTGASKGDFASGGGLDLPTGLLFAPDGALPVTFASFTGMSAPDGAFLQWTTESEVNNLGFYIYRSDAQDGDYERLTRALIPAKGEDAAMRVYEFLDETAEPGGLYWYQVEDVALDGAVERTKPIRVLFQPPSGDSPKLSTLWGTIKNRRRH